MFWRYMRLLFSKRGKERIAFEVAIYYMIPVILYTDCHFSFDEKIDTFYLKVPNLSISMSFINSVYGVEIYTIDDDGNKNIELDESMDDLVLFIRKVRLFFETVGYNIYLAAAK